MRLLDIQRQKTWVTAEARKELVLDDGPDWAAINLGKCRHGILCAFIQYEGLPVLCNQRNDVVGLATKTLDTINKLAEFSMTGEIK